MNADTQEEYEIIDAHTHIFPEKISVKASESIGEFYHMPMFSAGSSEKLLESGRKIGVSRYLVCSTATVPHQTGAINKFIHTECEKHPEFFGFGTLHPNMKDMGEELEKVLSQGLHGIKIHPDFQKFNIDDSKAFEMYAMLEGKLPILVHMGDDRYEYSRPSRLVRVLKNFPRLEVIAAHFGGYRRWEEARDVLRHF